MSGISSSTNTSSSPSTSSSTSTSSSKKFVKDPLTNKFSRPDRVEKKTSELFNQTNLSSSSAIAGNSGSLQGSKTGAGSNSSAQKKTSLASATTKSQVNEFDQTADNAVKSELDAGKDGIVGMPNFLGYLQKLQPGPPLPPPK